MIDPKMAGICAAAAFLLSCILGLASHATLVIIIVRALIFAIVFFGLVSGIQYLYNRFLADAGSAAPFDADFGHTVDVSVGDDEAPPPPFNGASPLTGGSGSEEDPNDANLEELTEDTEEVGDIDDIDNFDMPDDGIEELEEIDDDAGGVLDQNTKGVYDKRGNGLSVNIGDFVPSLLGNNEEDPPLEKPKPTEFSMNVGTVEMSMAQKSGNNTDFGNIDGRKAAGAIQTILKKDEN